VCMCEFLHHRGCLVAGRVARFGRVEECFGFIEPMKIEVSYTLVCLLSDLG
jgi:hypothetical protein